ncbi:MAG: yuxL-like peptidase [Acidimicrobiales bacterium]|nr:yuxL-like peptidase [Acidimicrobiales bacterium]
MTSPVEIVDVHGHVPEDLYSSWSASLSPDAERVAFVSDRSGEPQVWLRSLHGGPLEAVPLQGLRVVAVSWSPTGEWLACVVDPARGSRHEVWVVRADGTGQRLVGGRAPSTAALAGGRSRGWTEDGDLILTETSTTSQVLLVRPATGERELLHEGALTTAMDVSADGRSVLLRSGPRDARELFLAGSGAERRVIPEAPEGCGSSEAGCLAPDGSIVYARTDVRSELAELVAGELVVGRADAELDEVALSGDGRVAALVWNVGGGTSALSLLDVTTGRVADVPRLPRQVVHDCSLSHDGRVLVLTAEGPTDPKGVWYGPAGGTLTALSSPGTGPLRASVGASLARIDPTQVVEPELHHLRSGDGTPISGWLYRPPGAGPLPTMLWLHGGPEAQERPVYSSLFQSLLAEGIAVFAPNVRGSSGFGRTFRNADNGARRYGAFEDVVACAADLIETGISLAGRVGISGRSYGGYLTLAMLTRAPELFRVGVAVCGMSDFHTWYAATEPWIAAAAVSKYGDPERDAELLADLSPRHALDQLRAPLLLVHGSDDTNVPVGESLQVAAALESLGTPHRLLVFEGEGHELLATAHRVEFVQATLGWVLEHL